MPASQLRIAMLSVHSCPVGNLGAKDTGGMSVYIRELARELGRQGHLLDIYTRVHDPQDPQIINLGENARLIHLTAGGDEALSRLAVYPYLPEFTGNLEDFCRRNGLHYDLIFSHYWLSGCVGRYLQQLWQVPHIIMFHTLGAVKNAIGIGRQEPEIRVATERELTRSCHRVIASTEREKGNLIRYYGAPPERIGVVPCGVNLERFKPVAKGAARRQLGFNDGKIILFVGRIEPLKGIDRLLAAISYLPKIRGLRVVIIGGDGNSQQEIAELQGLSAKLGIPDLVTFLGPVGQEQLPYFYSAADVCVVPSYYESFGLVALESLACGTPVVASDVGDLKNIIIPGETGYVVAGNNPRHLAEKIALILAKTDGETISAPSLRASVARFNWSSIAALVLEEFNLVLADYLAQVR